MNPLVGYITVKWNKIPQYHLEFHVYSLADADSRPAQFSWHHAVIAQDAEGAFGSHSFFG